MVSWLKYTDNFLQAVAQKFREARLGAGGELISPLRLFKQLDDENIPLEHNIFDATTATELVEELMNKANAAVAQRLAEALPKRHSSAGKPRRTLVVSRRLWSV
jgi:protein SSD1